MHSVTWILAPMAFELEIAGTILPAISLILKRESMLIEKLLARILVAAVTNSTDV